jgi:hypothetical protein
LPGLKDVINNFAEIAKSLPENLQVACFELLLKDFLEGARSQERKPKPPAADTAPTDVKLTPPLTPPDTSNQQDFRLTELPVKMRKFLQTNALTIDQINNLFFKESNEIKPIYDDLKTTKTSESQIRIALLRALRTSMHSGEFEVNVASVREECTERKCYDSGNFLANFKNRHNLFDFGQLKKESSSFRLSPTGKSALAELVKRNSSKPCWKNSRVFLKRSKHFERR